VDWVVGQAFRLSRGNPQPQIPSSSSFSSSIKTEDDYENEDEEEKLPSHPPPRRELSGLGSAPAPGAFGRALAANCEARLGIRDVECLKVMSLILK